MSELEHLQKEKIERLEVRIARAIGILTYVVEERRYFDRQKAKEIRDILKGHS